MSHACAAIDLSPERGRIVVGELDGNGLSLREAHAFTSAVAWSNGTLRWNIQHIYGEILAGLRVAGRTHPGLASVAIDGWGMDFGLLDARGELLADPFHHLDRRTERIPARLHGRVPEGELWSATGLRPTPHSTLYQLYAMAWRRSSTLRRAARLLLIPELLAYWLSGVAVAEHTSAATTQCYDPEQRAWLGPLLERLGIPARLFPRVVESATTLGTMATRPARRAALAGVRVIAPAADASASAAAAIPAEGPSFAYVHTGAFSRVGTVVPAPVKHEAAWRLGFTNEAGVDGTFCLHRRMTGLRLVDECRRAWARAGEALGEDALASLAAAGRRFQAVFDPDDPSLRAPDDVFAAILTCCARTGQEVSGSRADLLRTILESLAWKHRRILGDLEALLGRRLEVIHLTGDGARSALLCQLTADACARPVLAGPVNAAAVGNLLAQLVAAGACGSWEEARRLARASFPPVRYEPRDPGAWDAAGVRLEPFLELGHLPG